jgi:hypothetical protein
VLRALRQAPRSRRFVSTRYLLHIAELRLRDDEPADPRLELAHRMPVEVMGHPDDAHEWEILISAAWGRVLGEHRLGSFADLRPSRPS